MIRTIATDHLIETNSLFNVLNKFSSDREEIGLPKLRTALSTVYVIETISVNSALYRISTRVEKQTS